MSQEEEKTKSYIRGHINRVRKWMSAFIAALENRSATHDQSKLEENEILGWIQMDQEPRYDYGTLEYTSKKERYSWLFDKHYAANRHHPEYFEIHKNKEAEMDLIDLIEMICDWVSYKDDIRYTEASKLVEVQCDRFGFSEELKQLMINTIRNNFIEIPGEEPKVVEVVKPVRIISDTQDVEGHAIDIRI